MKNKYIFLDRDGTLIYDIPYLRDPDRIELLENATKGLIYLRNLGFRFGIITNQSGISRGLVTLDEVKAINSYLCTLLGKFDLFFDFVSLCPHAPMANCLCRKPKVLMGAQAIEKFNVDVSTSFMIGDKDSDMEFGARLNLGTVRIESHYPCNFSSTYTAADILQAAMQIESFNDSGK